ncbi:MAG: amidase [Chloroflexi bacterium]|nr:amidase [Chloroflexota bacterium]
MELHELSLAEAARRIREQKLSPVALAEALLARIEALEPRLKAWVTVASREALAGARRRESQARSGTVLGPLHGVPIGVKDIISTRGLRTTMGSPLYANHVPTFDATLVRRLKRAGAIVLGKTVTVQFAAGDPPPTLNPWDAARTPGGSSTGSAVAVAARMVPGAIGTQTGGSVLRPAAYNGVVGLKPSYGRISRHGVYPYAWSLDTVGTLTRTVEDTALLLSVLAGHDPRDSSSLRVPVPDYLKALNGTMRAPRIGLVRGFFLETSTQEVQAHVEEAAARLAQQGARVQEVKLPPSFAAVSEAQRAIMNAELATYHRPQLLAHADAYAPKVRAAVESGFLVPAVSYIQGQQARRRFQQEMEALLAQVEVLLMPTEPGPAPRDLTTTGGPAFQRPWTFAGTPALSLPSGLGREGMPLGLQLVSGFLQEERLLAAARWCEKALGVELRPPGV